MLLLLTLGLNALAADNGAVVIVSVTPNGASLQDAVFGAKPASHQLTPSQHSVAVLDASGHVLATAMVPDTSFRGVLGPDGRGEATKLIASSASVYVPWPEGAVEIALGQERLRPRAPPPGVPVAMSLSGPDSERLDLVILGDGYTESELGTFEADAQRIIDHLASLEPYGAYRGLFNIWRIDQASEESGGTHLETNPTIERDTAYGCYYGCGGIARLVCCDDAAVLSEVAAGVPAADGVLVLVNDPVYGGAGGWQYATSYNGPDIGEQVAAHELGHSLIGLWDEYSYEYANAGEEGPNCSSNSENPSWSAWMDEPGLGAYPVCSYTNLFRPTDNACMMNSLQDAYCPVCREQAVLAIYSHIPGIIIATDPAEGTVDLDSAQSFSATLLGPDDGSLVSAWTFNDAAIGEGSAVELPGCGETGYLALTVHDPTPWVRTDMHQLLRDEANWLVRREPCPDTASPTDDSGGEGDDKRPCGCASAPNLPGWSLIAAIALASAVASRRRGRLHYDQLPSTREPQAPGVGPTPS